MAQTADNPAKDWTTALVLCLVLGALGGHRWYTGYKVSAIAQLLTLGGFGFWAFVDLVKIIRGSFVDARGRPLVRT